MRQEITLVSFFTNPDGSVEINADWNGYPMSQVYGSEAIMLQDNVDLMHTPADAMRWLLYYLTALGHNSATIQTVVGKKLVVDISPAVQQTIALV